MSESRTTGGRRIRGLDAEQRRAQRRDQLLDAALELFATKGYLNTSIEQICATAYVGTKSFYEVFDSREDCYVGLLGRVSDQTIELMVTALGAAAPDEAEAIPTLIGTFAHALVDDPRLAKVTFGPGSAISSAAERQRRTNRRQAAAFVEQVWRHYGHDGGNNHHIAIGVIGGLFDLIADWLLDADPDDPVAVDSLITDLTDFYRTVQAGLTRAAPHRA